MPNPIVDLGNNAWVMICTALIMFMTIPALGLFYGGLVKKKNVLSIMMQSFIALAVVSLLWVTVGYSLAFGPTELIPGVLGGFDWAFLNGINPADPSPFRVSNSGGPISHLTFVMFQCMFAVITPAVISGAFAERMKFSSYLIFIVAWLFIVYIPLAHMVWSPNGFLYKMGIMDFAGGLVVEINSGFSALAAVLIIGKRRNLRPLPPHNLPYTLIGAAMLWFGWFGFNAGSALAADGLAAHSFMTTNVAAAMAAVTWAFLDYLITKRPTILGAATGAVAGLVVITPSCAYIGLGGAMALGLLAGGICYWFVVYLKGRAGYDDSLDVFGVHGIAGVIGTLGVGLFADGRITQAFGLVNPQGGPLNGGFFGSWGAFGVQAFGVLIAIGVAFIGTLGVFYLIEKIRGLRVTEKEEAIGLDITQHNERAYTVLE